MVVSLTGECRWPWRHIEDRWQFRFQILSQLPVAANRVQQTEVNFIRKVLFMQDAKASVCHFGRIRDRDGNFQSLQMCCRSGQQSQRCAVVAGKGYLAEVVRVARLGVVRWLYSN